MVDLDIIAIQMKPTYLCSFIYVYNSIKSPLLNLVRKKSYNMIAASGSFHMKWDTAIRLTTSKLHENLMDCMCTC